ncbi:alpha/beta-hydrolase [Stereum hirsutum FP-91666 SS1]|uniref:Alpha/beta-hydrolase n=1 Tax=Stereum hirsutum (strain FP-91666) TaxID=721885 RepID=R7RXF1_STEHR|nr:alpha/beta-hydrolase [Stereum hirsutum FP-91666 SS1]EIM79540.1 alpha/beta-hydrolase [Stereum hirsutum FP-91666 SS1]
MPFTFRNQPLKAFYMTGAICLLIFVRIPIWTIRYILPSGRPSRRWSLGRSLIVSSLHTLIDLMYSTALLQSPPLEKLAEEGTDSGFVWVEATPSLIAGDILEKAKQNGVEAVRTAGFWFGERGPDGMVGQRAKSDELVFYHLHGGAYVMGAAHPSNSANKTLWNGLLEHSKIARLFALEYRLSSAPPFPSRNPFPAALIEAIAGYRYLVHDVGFDPSNIIISGDSAGGNLAYALARYMSAKEYGHELPRPGAVLLLSPTVDWTDTHTGPESSMQRNTRTDFVHSIFTSRYTYNALRGNLPSSEIATNSWISPASLKLKDSDTRGIFEGFPRTLIVSGALEMTLDPMRTLRDRMVADMGGNAVRYMEVPESTHDFLIQGWHEPERTETLKEIGRWVEGL